MYSFFEFDVNEKFDKLEEAYQNKSKIINEVANELRFYKIFLEMAKANVSFENIKSMLDMDIDKYESRKICEQLLRSKSDIVSQVLSVRKSKVEDSIHSIDNKISETESFIKSDEDLVAAQNAFHYLENGDEGVAESHFNLEELRGMSTLGFTFEEIRNKVKRAEYESDEELNKKVAALCLLRHETEKNN